MHARLGLPEEKDHYFKRSRTRGWRGFPTKVLEMSERFDTNFRSLAEPRQYSTRGGDRHDPQGFSHRPLDQTWTNTRVYEAFWGSPVVAGDHGRRGRPARHLFLTSAVASCRTGAGGVPVFRPGTTPSTIVRVPAGFSIAEAGSPARLPQRDELRAGVLPSLRSSTTNGRSGLFRTRTASRSNIAVSWVSVLGPAGLPGRLHHSPPHGSRRRPRRRRHKAKPAYASR